MFKGIHHIGVIYKDFSKIVEKLKAIYGMPEIFTGEYTTPVNTVIKELTEPLKIKLGFATFGDTMIELFQPLDDKSIYSEFLESHPEGGIHHVGILVEDIHEEIEKWDSMGIKRIISGALPTNSFVYYDTTEMFGYVTELLDNVPPSDNARRQIFKKL